MFQLGQRQFTKRDEVGDFHLNPVSDQGTFRKISAQFGRGTAIAAVHRGKWRSRGKFHIFILSIWGWVPPGTVFPPGMVSVNRIFFYVRPVRVVKTNTREAAAAG